MCQQTSKDAFDNDNQSSKPFDVVRFVIESNALEGYEGRSYQQGSPYFDDHLDAYYLAVEDITQKGLTRELILRGHGMLTGQLLPPSESGKFRSRQVRVGSHVGPSSALIDPLVMNFVKEFRRELSFEECWDAHFWFESIHPFIDGNGRWGRCLLNAMLLSNHHMPVIITYNRRFAYYDTIEDWRRSRWQKIMGDAISQSQT